jgi:ATP-binding cassette, subfamily C, bacterial CydD
VVALSALSALCTIGFAWNLSLFISRIFAAPYLGSNYDTIFFVLVFGAARALLVWLQEVLAVRAALASKVQLRAAFLAAVNRLGPSWLASRNVSDVALLATHRIDALDAYFSRFLPSLVGTVLVTPLMTVAIFGQDFWNGVIVLCTLPLIPLFMIFIGWATQDVQRRQLGALNTLSSHFTDVLRGLTTLRVFGRLSHQVVAIRANSEAFRKHTMKVLRMSFLSGLALEVGSSLAVALVAVSIGLRLIDGSMALGPGLLALLLAPEAFLPIRQVGANFHASNEGVAASAALLDAIDAAKDSTLVGGSSASKFAVGEVTQIVGPSGAGKTTAINRLRAELGAASVTWMPQRSALLSGTVRLNIVGPVGNPSTAALDEALNLAALDDVNLDLNVTDAAVNMSGGQLQRVALARAFYRCLTSDTEWLILDEPLSALDAQRSTRVSESIQRFALAGKHVVIASHQPLGISVKEVQVADV